MAEHVAQRITDHLTELADDYATHARQAAEDIAPAVATVADTVAAEITARDDRIAELEERLATLRADTAELLDTHGAADALCNDVDRLFTEPRVATDDAHPTAERTSQ